jgi:hypothetical protein
MFGYIFAILAILAIIPLAMLLMKGRPRPNRTAMSHPRGHERVEPADEAVSPEDVEPSPNRDAT